MKAIQAILNALAGNQSGHWGLVSDLSSEGRLQAEERTRDFGGGRHVEFLHLQCNAKGSVIDVDQSVEMDIAAIDDRLRKLIEKGRGDDRTVARCLITNFGRLSVDDQCGVLRRTRAARDKSTDFTVQIIVTGVWNLFRVQEHWKRNYDEISPAPDQKHVFFLSHPKHKDILKRLRNARLVSEPPTYADRICAKMLREFTDGDEPVLDYIIGSLKSQRLPLEAIESVISQAVESGEMTDLIKRRAASLSPGGWDLLISVLNYQFASRAERDIDVEDLRLAGFLTTQLVGTRRRLSISSPFVERVLRDRWNSIAGGRPPIYRGRDLARPSIAVNTAAYHLTAKIENMLRNVVVLSLSVQSDWTHRLGSVRVLSPGGEVIGSELLGLAREIQNTLLPFGVGGDLTNLAEQSKVSVETAANGGGKKQNKIPVVESAKDWQARQRKNTALELMGDSLIYFLTTGDLASILVNESEKIYPEVIKCIFPQKAELSTFLEHYIAIRSAVAHNQPISLGTLKRLETMCADLEKRIGQAYLQQ